MAPTYLDDVPTSSTGTTQWRSCRVCNQEKLLLHLRRSFPSLISEFHADYLLLTACLKDSNKDCFVTLFDFLAEFFRELLVIICGLTNLCEARQVEIILGFTALEQEAHFA